MRKAYRLCIIFALGLIICGASQGADQQPRGTVSTEEALKFLQGIQNGDKKMMYEAVNLTTAVVNQSREKLIKQKNNKLTKRQREECEHALRISGQIDFFLKKARPMFPKSASFLVTQTTTKEVPVGGRHSIHVIKIITANKTDAIRDKTGKQVKEMLVRLQQLTLDLAGRPVHELSFDSKDFEKFADRNFEVVSYF